MIIIKVELHSARTGKVTEIASAKIVNDGTGTKTRGNYKAWFWGAKKRQMRSEVEVTNWPRNAKHVWTLVAECLKNAKLMEKLNVQEN